MKSKNSRHHIKNRTILVTGGVGFVGSNLIEDFLKKNVADNLCG